MLAFPRQDVALVVVCWLALAGVASGQSFSQGNARYQRGDFRGAEKALGLALKSETGKEDRARIFKLLGICQFMLGDKKAAGDSFRQASKLRPGIQIAASEVLDDAVIGFFQTSVQSSGPAPAVKTATAKKGTFLKVASNVSGATVLMDGIIAGTTGDVITVDAGQVEIEVQAKGYLSQRARINVAKDRENAVTISLQKPKPKPVPKPVKTKAPVAFVEKRKPKPKKAKDGDLFAPTPSDDFLAGDRDPAAEFERETQTGGYPPPQGAGYPPQGAQLAYTTGGQPVYAIIVPQQSGAYVPPPPPAPPGATYAETDPYAPPPAYDPAAVPDPAEKPDASPAKVGGAKNNLLITLLPFGAGQFQNGSYLLGGAFLGTEAYALYYYLSNQPKLTKDTNERNRFVADKNEKQQEFSDEDRSYVEGADRAIKTNKQNLQYAQIAFAGLWAVGVVQALVAERDAPASSAKDRKTRKQRKYGGFGYVVPDEVTIAPLVANQVKSRGTGLDLSFDLRWEF